MEKELINTILNITKKHIKNLLQFKIIYAVLGNETCDLDSAVSSLVYSLLLHNLKTPSSIVVPILNIPRVQLPVKTEVVYFLNKCGVSLENIVCRDEIDLEALQTAGSLQLTLVDHHTLQPSDRQLAASVRNVVDHRPHDPAWPWPHADVTLNIVGSCSSLVADKLLKQAPELLTSSVATLLLGTVLLDTSCLSPSAGRATPLDHQVVDLLQARCASSLDREQLFQELQAAKADVSALTTDQLLIKDLKVAAGIPIAGLPMKVKEFLNRVDVEEAVYKFCDERNVDLCIIYGAGMQQGTLSRDIAVYTANNAAAATQVVSALMSCMEPRLELQPRPCSVQGFLYFDQLNIKATRKHILPIIRRVGETLQS